MPLINARAGVANKARCLALRLGLHLNPYFMHAKGKRLFTFCMQTHMKLRCSLMQHVSTFRALTHVTNDGSLVSLVKVNLLHSTTL